MSGKYTLHELNPLTALLSSQCCWN